MEQQQKEVQGYHHLGSVENEIEVSVKVRVGIKIVWEATGVTERHIQGQWRRP